DGNTGPIDGTASEDQRRAIDTAHRLSWENRENAYSVRRNDGKITLKVCHSRIRPRLDHASLLLVLGVGDAS
ncbi:MAG: hypothetical protein M3475_02685, partial [Actinomycetota bacterium]|nr:hypothetical protein [Actinomycetota bacterium]